MRENPFVGLRPFRTDEDYLFFGREEQTVELVRLLREHRFLAVVGTSGSGKSSLVRAGLMPALQGGTMTQAGSSWEIVIMRPGGSPRRNLAQALVDADFYDPEDAESLPRLEATLNRSRQGLLEAVRQSDVDPETNVLIVVDQFEELFRFRQRGMDSQEAASAFVKLLLHASDETDAKLFVAITMRSDYLGDCAEIPGLAEAVNDGEYLIPRLRRQQRRDAIEKPVNVGGAAIAPRLVQKLLNEVGDDADQLPVMQHALMRTWDVWAGDHADDEPMDLRHYEAAGRMEAALSHHADALFAALPNNAHRSAAEKLFKTLTERGPDNREIRRPTVLSKVVEISGCERAVIEEVIEAYRQPGVTFLMPLADVELASETVIDISHESLMRVWTRLRAWVEDEAQSARIFQRLSDTARLHAEGKAGLYKDPDLQIARTWHEEQGPTTAWAEQYGGGFEGAVAFLETSHETAEKETRAREEARQRELEQARALAESEAKASRVFKRFALVVALLAFAAVVLAAWALDSRSEVQELLGVTEEAKREVEGVYEASKHHQGMLWLERANRQRFEKSLVGARLSAARAIGFEGFGRETRDEAFRQAHPALLRKGSEAWKRAENLVRRSSNLSPIWSSPVNANLKTHVHPAITPDHSLIAGADHSTTLRFWDGVTGEALPSWELDGLAHDAFFLSNQRLFLRLKDGYEVWEVPQRKRVARIPSEASRQRLVPGRQWIAEGGAASSGVTFWDLETGAKVRTVALAVDALEGETPSFEVDRDGTALAYIVENRIALQSMDAHEEVRWFEAPEGYAFKELALSQDGRRLVGVASPETGEGGRRQGRERGARRLSEAGPQEAGRASRGGPDDGRGRELEHEARRGPAPEPARGPASEGRPEPDRGSRRGPGEGPARGGPGERPSGAEEAHRWMVWSVETGELECEHALESQYRLMNAGSSLVGPFLEDGRLWLRSRAQQGGFFDPVTGELERLQSVWKRMGLASHWISARMQTNGRLLVSSETSLVVARYPEVELVGGTPSGHRGGVSQATFSPDGRWMVSAGEDGVRLWDAATGKEMRALTDSSSFGVAFSPNGARLFSSHYTEDEGGLWVWDTETWTQANRIQGRAYRLSASPDGRCLAYVDEEDRVHVVDAHTLQPLTRPLTLWQRREESSGPVQQPGPMSGFALANLSQITSLAFEPGEKRLAVGARPEQTLRRRGSAPTDGRQGPAPSLALWDWGAGEEVYESLQPPGESVRTSPVGALTFSDDGAWLAWGEGPKIHLLNRATGKREVLVGLHNASAYSALAFSADGKSFAAGTGDRGAVLLWSFAARECIAEVDGHGSDIGSLEFAPDGRSLLTGSADATLRLWELATQDLEIRGVGEKNYTFVRFIDDQHVLGLRENALDTVDVETGLVVDSVEVPIRQALSIYIQLSPDHSLITGRRLDPLAGRLGGAMVVEVASGNVFHLPERLMSDSRWVSFSPVNGAVVVSDNEAGWVEWLDRHSLEPLARYEVPGMGYGPMEVSADGKTMATFSNAEGKLLLLSGLNFQDRQILDSRDDKGFRRFRFHPSEPHRLACLHDDGSVSLLDTETGAELGFFEGEESRYGPHYHAIRWSRDGKFIASRTEKNGVRLLKVPSLEVDEEFDTLSLAHLSSGARDFFKSAAFCFDISPDGRLLVVNVSDEGLYVWNLERTGGEFDPVRVASLMDYFALEQGRSMDKPVLDEEEAAPSSAGATWHPESLSSRVSDHLYQGIEYPVAPFSAGTHYDILQAEEPESARFRRLFDRYLSAKDWRAAVAVLPLLSEEDVSAARDQFVDEVVEAVVRGLESGVGEAWLDLAASVNPGSEKVRVAREALTQQ